MTAAGSTPSSAAAAVKVACLGLGNMGRGIAANVADAGFDTTVWNRSPDRAESFARETSDAGAARVRAAPTPAEAVADADVIVTCLFDDASVLETTTGTDGILDGMSATAVHLGTTTVSPSCTRLLVDAHTAAVRRRLRRAGGLGHLRAWRLRAQRRHEGRRHDA